MNWFGNAPEEFGPRFACVLGGFFVGYLVAYIRGYHAGHDDAGRAWKATSDRAAADVAGDGWTPYTNPASGRTGFVHTDGRVVYDPPEGESCN